MAIIQSGNMRITLVVAVKSQELEVEVEVWQGSISDFLRVLLARRQNEEVGYGEKVHVLLLNFKCMSQFALVDYIVLAYVRSHHQIRVYYLD